MEYALQGFLPVYTLVSPAETNPGGRYVAFWIWCSSRFDEVLELCVGDLETIHVLRVQEDGMNWLRDASLTHLEESGWYDYHLVSQTDFGMQSNGL